MKKMSVNSLVIIGLCIAFSMVLSFIESQLPPFIAIPGIKVGMANIAVVFILYKMGWKQAASVSKFASCCPLSFSDKPLASFTALPVQF